MGRNVSGSDESGQYGAGTHVGGLAGGTRADHAELRDAILITDAQQSLDDQHRARVRKYLTLMAFRIPALVIAGIVYTATGSGLWALAIVAVSIPLPWVAVLIANDRPPRKRGEVPQYLYGDHHTVIGPQPLSAEAYVPETDRPGARVIDSSILESEPAEPRSANTQSADTQSAEPRSGRRGRDV